MGYTKRDLIDFANSIDEKDNSKMDEWIKEFCLANISDNDKNELLRLYNYLFKEYGGQYDFFCNLVNSKDYINAIKLSKLMANCFDESREDVRQTILGKDLNFVFKDLLIQPGGTGVAVITRANKLVERGYNINLISINEIQDYDEIRKYFYDVQNISERINFINMFEYYCKKNTSSPEIATHSMDGSDYLIKEIENPDSSVTYEYYDKSDSSQKVMSELYVKGALALRIDNRNSKREYFTPDGFNYLVIIKNKCYLNNRQTGTTIEFGSYSEFLGYFLDEYCRTSTEKPFIIFDNTFNGYHIRHVDSHETMKIASIHGNPYYRSGKPEINSERTVNKNITHFQSINDYRSFVVLTDSMKEDLTNDTNYRNFVAIPNLISEDKFDYEAPEKDFNKISIFTRISHGKNLSDCLKAFKIVCDKRSDAKLNIYGRADKSEIEKLTLLAKELEIDGNVNFEGFISDVDGEMRSSLCTLMSSYYEGFPMAILESMANSTPVITYDTNYGPRDMISNGVDGIVVDFGDYEAMADHILDFIDNPQKAVDMGLKAKQNIKDNYSSEIVCNKWEDLFIDTYARSEIEDFQRLFNEKNKNKKLEMENKSLLKFKKDVLNSTSWKLTKPLRSLTGLLNRGSSKK
ncbi:glycosyltransferase [Methanobrevibacter sp.]|uniref:glycosyltransferase n=1 Tax=Methanobrevibacter sp. TaxID=66852 RepID=UPI00389028F1